MTDSKARRTARQAALAGRTAPDAAPPGSTAATVRTKPVRITLDLQPPDYEALNGHALRIAMEVGRKIPTAAVLRALGALLDDDAIRARVVDHIREHGTSVV